MALLVQNTKMKKSSQNGILVYNWTLPAFQSVTGLKTCPNAGSCAAGCYARMGTYRFNNVAKKHEQNLVLSQSAEFVTLMIQEIEVLQAKAAKAGKRLKIRIHDAGDFYSLEYLVKWSIIMRHFESMSHVLFYAYTKQVEMIKSFGKLSNFETIFSFGGRQDKMIDLDNDRHSRVFESVDMLEAAGYIDASNDDMIALSQENHRIGLVYHGVKNYENTQWGKVS